MTRALLVTGMNPLCPPSGELARAAQIHALMAGLGVGVDVLSVHPRRDAAAQDLAWLPRDAALGVAPVYADRLDEPQNTEALAALLARIAPAEGFRGACLLGIDLPVGVLPGVPRIYDAGDGQVRVSPAMAPNLLLAGDEQVHRLFRGKAARSSRLPFDGGGVGPGRVTQLGHIGWPGGLDGDLASGWRDVLAILAARHEPLRAGLLLDAATLRADVVPGIYHPRWSRDGTTAGASRALGLAVLPGKRLEGQLDALVRLVLRGCPVLTTPEISDRFEGRWHLPTADGPEGLAGWIEGWADGRDVPMLRDGAARTAAAFRSDIDAMTSHVRALVAGTLGLWP